MSRRPRWFGPNPFRLGFWPVSWQGWAVTLALVLSPLLIQHLTAPLLNKEIAWALVAFGYAALVVLTFGDDRDGS